MHCSTFRSIVVAMVLLEIVLCFSYVYLQNGSRAGERILPWYVAALWPSCTVRPYIALARAAPTRPRSQAISPIV